MKILLCKGKNRIFAAVLWISEDNKFNLKTNANGIRIRKMVIGCCQVYADSIDSSSKKAKKSMQNLLASFDELHDITESATDTGTEDDYTQFFTEAGIETNIDAFYKRLRDGFKKGDLSSVGVDLADKLNYTFMYPKKHHKFKLMVLLPNIYHNNNLLTY